MAFNGTILTCHGMQSDSTFVTCIPLTKKQLVHNPDVSLPPLYSKTGRHAIGKALSLALKQGANLWNKDPLDNYLQFVSILMASSRNYDLNSNYDIR